MPGILRTLDVGSSVTATLLRLGAGAQVAGVGPRPEQPLELWDFEGCPYCRKVREALSILDLDASVYPLPQERHALPAGPDRARRQGTVSVPARPEHGARDVRIG